MRPDEYAAFIVIGLSPLFFLWAFAVFRKPVEKVFEDVYRGIPLFDNPGPRHVHVTFTTYRGVLAWVTITHHDFHTSVQSAPIVLKRLCWFNFKYGLFAAGGLFVPFLSVFHYRKQRQSIDLQMFEMSTLAGRKHPVDSDVSEIIDID